MPMIIGIARDTRASHLEKLQEGLKADALITSAGVSAGDRDLVREVLEELGARQLFWKVGIKPGGPTAFALHGATPVFSLPGNPVSAMITFEEFVRPALLKMQGHHRVLRPLFKVVLREELRKKPGKVQIVRIRLEREDGRWYAASAGDQRTSILRTMVDAEAIAVLPADSTCFAAGDRGGRSLLRESYRLGGGKPMNDYLGAHMSIAGGLHLAIDRAVAAGCGVVQIFTRNSNQWKGKAVSEADAALFREKFAASGLHEVVSHDIYLINLAAPPGEGRDKSLAAFRDELETCARLGIAKVVMHPGSHLADPPGTGLGRVIEAFDHLFREVPQFEGKVLLETTAGQGTNLGRTFEELQTIIDGSKFPEKFGVASTRATPLPLATTPPRRQATPIPWSSSTASSAWTASMLPFQRLEKGARLPRGPARPHRPGGPGVEPFRFILNDPGFASIPKILRPPRGTTTRWMRVNLGICGGW